MRLKDVVFHPFEISFVGYSGSGKTTLIEKLVSQFAKKYRIGYIKHDAHQFELDKPGKDTYRNFEAGCSQIFINNDSQWALRGRGELSSLLLKQNLLDMDFVLVEGFKNSKMPKLIMLDERHEILNLLPDLEQVMGLIYPHQPISNLDIPQFHRDDVGGIEHFILNRFSMAKAPLYGLVIAGGKSTRMQSDKGALKYHGTSQVEHLHGLLGRICKQVFISARTEQGQLSHLSQLPQIADKFVDMGPMGGILSAQIEHPGAAYLVVAVDLPYVDQGTLAHLVEHRNFLKVATCYINPEKKWREPLLTIWEPKSHSKLLQHMGEGRTCPRKVLYGSEVCELNLVNSKALTNANTPEDFINITSDLKGVVL